MFEPLDCRVKFCEPFRLQKIINNMIVFLMNINLII